MLILVVAYSGKEKLREREIANIERPDKFFVINCENILKNKKMMSLSQITTNVSYIQLETNPSCLINDLSRTKFFFADSLIFVQNNNQVLKFSVKGKFIKKITYPGRGPGETGLIKSMSLIADKRLLVVHQRDKLLFFSFNGELVKTVTVPYHQEVKVLNDSRFIAYDPATNGSEKYNFILTSDHGDTISAVKNYTTWKKAYTGTIIITSPRNEAFYLNNNSYFFKSNYNDTVYYVNSTKDKIESSYIIDFGKYKVPEDLIPEKIVSDPIKLQNFYKRAVNFYQGKPFEAYNKVFIRASCMGKREFKYLLYDKSSNEGCLLVNEDGESTGIFNDWDGGFDFWPTGQKSNNQIIMPIEALDFMKKWESNNSDTRTIKNPDKQKTLRNVIAGLEDTDNPIIMVVTLKSNF